MGLINVRQGVLKARLLYELNAQSLYYMHEPSEFHFLGQDMINVIMEIPFKDCLM